MMLISILSLNSITYANTDLNNKLRYCENERDAAERAVSLCDEALNVCQEETINLQDQEAKHQEIEQIQTKEIASKTSEIREAKAGSVVGKVLFGILGVVVGVVLHVPIAAFIK